MLRTDTAPQAKYLRDYQKPDFKIDSLHLTFSIFEGSTTVKAATKFTRLNPQAKNLVLDGERMTLKSIAVNGEKLSENRYTISETTLTIADVPDSFTAEIVTGIEPEKNTALEGLYSSGGNYCTQCEPEGFRKITYYLDRSDVMTVFTTRIEADKKTYPVLLSNGNCLEKGDLKDGRHFAVWHDPHPKPCYLFALVAGDLACNADSFTTMSGRAVKLGILTALAGEAVHRGGKDIDDAGGG